MSESQSLGQYAWTSRILHWLMVVMVLTMLGIGVNMVASLGWYPTLIAIHRPLGITIFILVVIRFINRQINPPPDWPPTMPAAERLLATWSERIMYALMFLLPLIGWGMLSAARYPIVMFGPVHLPPILPHSPMLHAALRKAHTFGAYLFLLTILAHLGGVLTHAIVTRDGVLKRMVPWKANAVKANEEAMANL